MELVNLADTAQGEEVQNPATSIPRILILAVIINGMLTFGWFIALLFSIGDAEPALGFPYHRNILPGHWPNQRCDCYDVGYHHSCLFAVVRIMAFTSRLTWAFARDR